MPDRLEEFGSALLEPDLSVPAGIVGPDGQSSVRRFAVYRNNVVVSLIDAVTAAYPVVVRLVGEQFFRAIARIYVAGHPPASPIMLHYGEGFADFVATFTPAASVPYLADIARLERAWLEAYHAREAWPASLKELASIPAEAFGRVRLRLHPSLRLVRSRFPIVTIWTMNVQGGVPAPVDLSTPQHALVLRPHAEVEVRALSNDSAAFVAALQHGDTAEDAAKGALKVNPKFDLVGNLRDLMNLGLVAGWTLDGVEFGPRGDGHVHAAQ